MMMRLTTPASYLKQFINKSDRAYYANPVLVQPLYSERDTRLTWVHDPATGRTFPVDPKHLRNAEGGAL